MKHSPFAVPDDFVNLLVEPKAYERAFWFIFSKGKLLLEGENLPTQCLYSIDRVLYMGTWQGTHLFAAETEENVPETALRPLQALHSILRPEEYALAGRSMELLHWDRIHKYCGSCGALTVSRQDERCRECPLCGLLAYPKMSVAVLALVKREDKILLARGRNFPQPFYSALAGFLDMGETLEQCVAREVREETGLIVENIRYFGNQPWPLSHSLMVGFFCDWEAGELQLDPVEIADAGWFSRDNLPFLPPPISLARLLIDAFVLEFTS